MQTRRLLTAKRILNWISLRPYANNLCTEGASYWILSVRTIVLIMALAEAISWSYLGYNISQNSHPWLAGGLVGVSIFLMVWILDSTFLTLDTARAYYEKRLNGNEEDALWTEKSKTASGVILRILILSGTLYISAPYLALRVFSGDIDSRIEAK